MEADQLMRAVLQSFLDADLRAEVVVPRMERQGRTADAGAGPSYDATTQATGRRVNSTSYKPPEPPRISPYSSHIADSTAQAVDGQYASVYMVQHCKVTPTSPAPMPSEFPPQRAEVSYGCDNFQVGGTGSGETGPAPVKTTSYRGAGLNWSNRGDVYTPRVSRCSDSFERSLRKYPSVSPERSAEALQRLVTYAMPRTYRYPRHSPQRSPHRSPQRVAADRKYEDYRPMAPEEYPTRESREELNQFRQASKQAFARQEDIRNIREMSRKLRRTLKSISSYTHTHTLATYSDGVDREYHERDTPILETSEAEQDEQTPYRCPVDTPVQTVAPTTSLEVQATSVSSLPTCKRTIAVPISPTSSSLTTRIHDLPNPHVTKSVQTSLFRKSVETITSSTEILNYNPVQVIVKKSKTLSDFRLERDLKSEILEWLDDNNDPKVEQIKEVVMKNLNFRLKGVSTIKTEKIRVKMGNCLKSDKKDLKIPLGHELNKKKNDLLEPKDAKSVTDQNEFKNVMKGWLSNATSIKNHDFASLPEEKDKILDTFVDSLKNLANKKSDHSNEQTLRESILRILDKLLIEVNACDKAAFLNKLTDELLNKLDKLLFSNTNTKSSSCVKEKSTTNLHETQVEMTEKRTTDVENNEMREDLNTDIIKETLDLVDALKASMNNKIGLEEIASKFHKASVKAGHYGDVHYKKIVTNFRTQPLTVFMVQNVSKKYTNKPSGCNLLQHSIGTFVDRDIEANLNRYKIQLAQQIEQWLSDLEYCRVKAIDFRQAIVFDLANDIVDRQKYLKFNKNNSTDVDELEHLKYLIFKWIKRYVGEENMETVNHAVELMAMIRNIPVPVLSKSQDLLYKSNTPKMDIFGISGSKSESNFHDRRDSQSDTAILHAIIDNERNQPNLNRRVSTNSNFTKSNETYNIRQCNIINKEQHSSRDSSESSRSRHDVHESYSDTCKHGNHARGTTMDFSTHDTNTTKSNYSTCRSQIQLLKESMFTNYLLQNIVPNKRNNNRNIIYEESRHGRNSWQRKSNSSKASVKSKSCEADCSKQSRKRDKSKNESTNKAPPQCLLTPVPSNSGKPSSAAALLMAEWRPHPVFTPPPPGQPPHGQVYEEFKEYLKAWCNELPIHAKTCEEFQAAEKYRLGVINGVWRMLTKLKAQPAVFQNKFYYEDVLGKEIDGLLDCLPPSQELKEKRYPLKAKLLDKISEMNDIIKEIEIPDNFKQIIAQRQQLIKEQLKKGEIRKTVRSDREDPGKIMEEILKYCTLDDFLKHIDYKETNIFLVKAYKNRLLKRIQEYIDNAKIAHGKDIVGLCDVWQEDDVYEVLKRVPVPTEVNDKEEADEILLGLEIEQWMNDLPIIKNDDETEQRQRARLRDALTKNLHEMEKRVDITNCCSNTNLKHEISVFLDMVPLEKDQDLKINEMVEDLTDRLKRHKPDGRRKSVAFQSWSQHHNGNQSNRLLCCNNRPTTSSDIYTPEEKRILKEKKDAPYRDLCSTRIEQPMQWENEDERLRAVFREGDEYYSIIEPQGPTPLMASTFRHSFDQAPHGEPPGHESVLRDSYGPRYTLRHEDSNRYPDVMGSPMPNVPNSDIQFHSLQEARSYCLPAAHGTPRSGGIMMQDAPRSPLQTSPHVQRRISDLSAFSPPRSQHPNVSLPRRESIQGYATSYRPPQEPSFHSMFSVRNEPFTGPQPYVQPRSFVEPQSYIAPQPYTEPQAYIEPQPYIEPQSTYIPDQPRFSRGPRSHGKADSGRRQEQDSVPTEYSRGIPEPLEVSVQVHDAPRSRQPANPGLVSIVSQQQPDPLETSRNLRTIDPNPGQPSKRISPARANEVIREPPANANRYPQTQGPAPSRQTTRNQASREPSQRPGVASNAIPTEISIRPQYYSTPNNEGNAPPNNRERRQLEREGRRDMDAEEGEERCHCRARFREWRENTRHDCHTCDNCIHGEFYPYHYPPSPNVYQPFMFPLHGRPPHPPHCRR